MSLKGAVWNLYLSPLVIAQFELPSISRLGRFHMFLTLPKTIPGCCMSAVQAFLKHCGKRRNCSGRAISQFPTVFSTHLENDLPFSSNLKLSSANSFSLE